MAIGKAFSTKVNANIGTSSTSKDWHEEIGKLRESLLCGADTVMDLSTGKSIVETREALLRRRPCRSAPYRSMRRLSERAVPKL